MNIIFGEAAAAVRGREETKYKNLYYLNLIVFLMEELYGNGHRSTIQINPNSSFVHHHSVERTANCSKSKVKMKQLVISNEIPGGRAFAVGDQRLDCCSKVTRGDSNFTYLKQNYDSDATN